MGIAVGVIVGLIVLAAIAYAVYRGSGAKRDSGPDAKGSEAEVLGGQAPVAEFHVRGDQAQVYFDVPLPEDVDEVLTSLLKHEAVEVVREKRHSLPIDQVTSVVSFGRSGSEFVEVGSVDLDTPGTLPPPAPPPVVFKSGGPDPLSTFAAGDTSSTPGTAAAVPEEGLAAIGAELQLPAQISSGLRLQGITPEESEAGDLVLGILRLTGFTVAPGDQARSYIASNAGGRTFVVVDELSQADYPELEEGVINKFMASFASSGLDRGLLISDKFGPYLVYEKERREPRVQFITRERIQQFVDSIVLK